MSFFPAQNDNDCTVGEVEEGTTLIGFPGDAYASELRDSCSPTLLTECLWNTPCMFFSCMQATFGPFGKPYQQGPDSCLYRNSWRSKMHGAVYGCS